MYILHVTYDSHLFTFSVISTSHSADESYSSFACICVTTISNEECYNSNSRKQNACRATFRNSQSLEQRSMLNDIIPDDESNPACWARLYSLAAVTTINVTFLQRQQTDKQYEKSTRRQFLNISFSHGCFIWLIIKDSNITWLTLHCLWS